MTRVPYIIWSIILFVIGVIGYFMLKSYHSEDEHTIARIISFIFLVGIMIINVKRFHYRGKSGWNVLWFFIPFVYPIYTIYNCIKDD